MIASLLRLPVLAPLALAALIGPASVRAQEALVIPVLLERPGPEQGGGTAGGSAAIAERPGFLDRQLLFPRVRRAYDRKAARVDQALEARGVEEMGEVFFRVFKREQELEVWVREVGAGEYTLIRTYPVCETSGRPGPKRREGDRQIPEGFYTIDVFNPESRFHLSMRVDYPNAVDRVRGQGGPLGGEIYIHGGCVTVGCVPVTDSYIEEIYLLAASARDAGQRRIPVHIFPTRLNDDGLRWLARNYGTDHPDYPFWRNLQEGYTVFERNRVLTPIEYDRDRYIFRSHGPLGTPIPARIPVPAPTISASDPVAPAGPRACPDRGGSGSDCENPRNLR